MTLYGIGDNWRKSSYSGDDCLHARRAAGGEVQVLDGKEPSSRLEVSAASWTAFLGEVKGER